VSSSSTTGSTAGFSEANLAYFKRIADMNLSVETLVGFGIADAHTFSQASQYSRGAIIGSAFIRHLEERGTKHIADFIKDLTEKHV
jgi:tryptophan synthase alpha chain